MRAYVRDILRSLQTDDLPSSKYTVLPVDVDTAKLALLLDGRVVGESLELQALAGLLVWSINQEVAHRTREHVLIHGAAASRQERSVVIVGESGAGKSTLVTALGRAGWSYLTDEAVAVDRRSGHIDPYRKPITLKRGSWAIFPELEPITPLASPAFNTDRWLLEPSSLHFDPPTRSALMRWIVFPSRAGDPQPSLHPVREADALVRVLRQCLNPQVIEQSDLELFVSIFRQCDAYELRYGAVDDGVRLAEELASSSR